LRAVRAALFSRARYKPPLAVQAATVAPSNYVAELDARTAAIVDAASAACSQAAAAAAQGGTVVVAVAVPGSAAPLALRAGGGGAALPAELRRLKREFERACAADPPAGGVGAIEARFVAFLNAHLGARA
jgi:hypothetical protein